MENEQNQLTESLEDYLEVILELESTHKVARVKDIAERLGVLRGSVSTAMKKLTEMGLINYEPYSFITLTSEGRKAAGRISHRHQVLLGFLRDVLKLDPDVAEQNACRMEHAMDDATVERLVRFIEYLSNCPRTGRDWIESFETYLVTEQRAPEDCLACLTGCLERFRADEGGTGDD